MIWLVLAIWFALAALFAWGWARFMGPLRDWSQK